MHETLHSVRGGIQPISTPEKHPHMMRKLRCLYCSHSLLVQSCPRKTNRWFCRQKLPRVTHCIRKNTVFFTEFPRLRPVYEGSEPVVNAVQICSGLVPPCGLRVPRVSWPDSSTGSLLPQAEVDITHVRHPPQSSPKTLEIQRDGT